MPSGTSTAILGGNAMPIPSRARRSTANPQRAKAATMAIWAFAVVEALGIGYAIWTC